MAQLTSSHVSLGKVASFLGIVQGLSWFVMSLLCIIEFSIEKPPSSSGNYMDEFNTRVYHFYLDQNATLPPGTLITPTAFAVFCAIYIVLVTIWIVISLFQISVLRKRSVNIPILFKDWSLITLAISMLDFILVVLMGCDYGQHCLPAYPESTCVNTVIPVMVIASRGFALWFVNLFVAWRVYKDAKTLRRGRSYEGTFGGIIPLYGTHSTISRAATIPRANVLQGPSMYSRQQENIRNDNFWNLNLRTAMENRTPPVTPKGPTANKNRFFY